MINENIRKNTIWNIIGTTINAFSSLFFMIIVTRVNGVFDAGIFTFAFSTATMFNIIGVYAGRIYQVTDNDNNTNKDYFISRIISCGLMLIISLLFVKIRNYNGVKALIIIIVCIWKLLEAAADVIYAYFQKDDELYKVGISLTIKNILGLFFFLIVDLLTKDVLFSCLAFVCIYIFLLLFYDCRKLKSMNILNEKWSVEDIKKIYINGFATFCTTFLKMYLINASKYSIDSLTSDDIQAIFGIIIMPATVMILIAQFIIHPFLLFINQKIKEKNYADLSKIIIKMSAFICIIGIIAVIGCHFVGIFVFKLIYGLNLEKYKICLDIILIGAIFYALTSIINTVLIAMRHTVVQMIVYAIISIISLFSSYYLVLKKGIFGASINYLFVMFLSFIVFLIVYKIIVKRKVSKNGK